MRKSVEKRLREQQSESTRAPKQKYSIKLPPLPYRTVFEALHKYRWPLVAAIFVVVIGSILSILTVAHVSAAQKRNSAYHNLEQARNKDSLAQQQTKKALANTLLAAAQAAQIAAQEAASQQAALAKAQQASSNPVDLSCSTPNAHSDPRSIAVIVNKKHCMQPIDYTPQLTYVAGGYPMSVLAAPSFNQMLADSGQPIGVTSAFRSYSDQVLTYNHWAAIDGSTTAADTVSARPGYSEHQTGLAADLSCNGAGLDSFANTPCYAWLTQNAAKYGFIQRYQSGYTAITGYDPEPWHWRYVGATVALDMQARGIHTLEQYFGISGGDYAS